MQLFALRMFPLTALILTWELCLRGKDQLIFYFGLPSKILDAIISRIADGSLLTDFFVTFTETFLGFIIGNTFGTLIGLSLWFSTKGFQIAKPYIIALGSAPIFALAPLMIIWFGTGMYSKVMIAALSTIFIALFQAYSGAETVDKNYLKLMKSLGASKIQVFRKIIAPSSIVWVMAAFKINVGFALLGAFIGEFISSNQGLGHLIVVASGLFDISLIMAGVLMMMVIALSINLLLGKLEQPIKKFVATSL